MHEVVPDDHNLPVSPEITLRYLEAPDEEGYRRNLMAFDTPELRDKYVVRELDAGDINADGYSREQRIGIMQDELTRMQAAGIRVPRVVCGLPSDWNSEGQGTEQQGVIIAVERIVPVDPDSVDPSVLAQQAHRTLAGMSTFLSDSWSGERMAARMPYSVDVLKAEQFVYGVAEGEEAPDFFMVDPVGNIDHPDPNDDIPYEIQQDNIIDSAREFAEMTGDPTLVDDARQMAVPYDALQR